MKDIIKSYDLGGAYTGLETAWWKHNNEIPSQYEIKQFFVKEVEWNRWKLNNVNRDIESIYQMKSANIGKNFKPNKRTVTHSSAHGYEIIFTWSEKAIHQRGLEIRDLEVWWDSGTNFDIQKFHESIISIVETSTENSPVNMIVMGDQLQMREFDINVPKIDVELNYGKEWAEKHDYLMEALTVKPKKGIALLHGLPGTGKSMYIRYLISLLADNRSIIYLPNQMINCITDPNFIPLMAEYANSLIVIEDADEAIKSRKNGGNTVDKLLNLADGILSDFLGTQIICTFNNDITTIDDALLRKGRLILKHKFDKLSIEQSQRLSDNLGFEKKIDHEMTLAEIYNQNDKFEERSDSARIGFGR